MHALRMLNLCKILHGKLVSDVISDHDLPLASNSNPPDHSFLQCSVQLSGYSKLNEINFDKEDQASGNTDNSHNFLKRKYNVKSISTNIFSSERCVVALNGIIDSLLRVQNVKNEIDAIYDTLINTLHDEMSEHILYKDIRSSTRKVKNRGKPYWNNELKNLFKRACKAEKNYLRFKGDHRRKLTLKMEFKTARKTFDKILRQEERKFTKERREKIQTLNTSNPKEFWNEIKKLGPGRKNTIIDNVVMDDGTYSNDPNVIRERWKEEYSELFSENTTNVDNEFMERIKALNSQWELEFEQLRVNVDDNESQHISSMNDEITIEETKRAIRKAKNEKAVGLDNIPNEIIKNDKLLTVLHRLFNTCFTHGIVPEYWAKSIIHPLLKKGKDYRDPLGYRCISLISTIAKTYSNILNTRLLEYLEDNSLLSEEQNGFRKLRSCLDHIYSLCTILRNRKLANKDTFLCFIDFQKAFDSVDHNLLFHKLLSIGIHGNMYKAIKSTYEKLQAAVRLNGSLTDWFSVEAGVRQGDNLAPTLFAVFVDDLVTEINRIGKGINIGTDSLSCLLYADDIVLISDTVDGLQSLLHCVTDWSKTWRLKVNTDKTKIMHVRKASKPKNDYEFQLNNMTLETVSKYRYLGLVITENLDYKETTNELVSSGSRSLGSLVSKYYAMDGMDFDTYTKIFDSTVLPILEYGSGVWGNKRYDSLERLQYRAIRTFLGVSLTTPIPAITGDMGWYPVHHRIQVNIVRLYCRLVKLPDTRICRKVFVWDQNISTRYRDTCGSITQRNCLIHADSAMYFF
ncbi:unnamed protein product [Mytilus edulis]|uniref:Reverse transcriptase domain-containing protein n=1 Tax=Mytilus edulis TaxID=6550 RepID=A0A8S3UC41_MYTED|nr:unnamed protein product [Mytilus edulis]